MAIDRASKACENRSHQLNWKLMPVRDEGTSYHYLPPARYVPLLPEVEERLSEVLNSFVPAVEQGAAWTTDASYRETAEAIEAARAEGVLAVEMEAASLYAFAHAKKQAVVCFAHIINCMGVNDADFEKGEADGNLFYEPQRTLESSLSRQSAG